VLYVLGALAEFYVAALAEEIRLSRLQQARNSYLTGSYRFGDLQLLRGPVLLKKCMCQLAA